MTQQSETDGRTDGAAEDVATHSVHKYRQDLPGEGQAAPGRDSGRDPVPPQCPSLQPKGATPIEVRTDLAGFESAFPTFSFMISTGWDGPRIEAWRDTTRSGLYAIITDDPDELLRELNMAVR
jgi:hypothetical protein